MSKNGVQFFFIPAANVQSEKDVTAETIAFSSYKKLVYKKHVTEIRQKLKNIGRLSFKK